MASKEIDPLDVLKHGDVQKKTWEEPCSTCDLNAQAKLLFSRASLDIPTYVDVLQPTPSQQSHEVYMKDTHAHSNEESMLAHTK
ncbi:24729_t:CDS:2, partial [Racocetra persica]